MFKTPFSFEGRIRRTEFGISFLVYVVFYFFQLFIIEAGGGVGAIVGLILVVPMVWFLWAQGAKRCHDVSRSGWWQIIPFYFFVLLFKNGDTGPNEYGVDPKDPNASMSPQSETLDGHLIK